MARGGIRARRASVHRRPDGRARRSPFTRAWPAQPAQRALRIRQRPVEPAPFIIPRWQSAKSYLTGSAGSSRRSDAVMSRRHPPARARVARQPQAPPEADHVRVERHDQLRRGTRVHTPRSTASRRTIQRRNRFSRLQALPVDGRGKKYDTPGWTARRPPSDVERQRAASRTTRSAGSTSARRRRARAGRTLRPIPPRRSSAAVASISATRSSPRVQRCTSGANARRVARGIEAADVLRRATGPSTASTRSIDCSTLATRPNASAAAQNPTTSRSRASEYRRTISIGSAMRRGPVVPREPVQRRSIRRRAAPRQPARSGPLAAGVDGASRSSSRLMPRRRPRPNDRGARHLVVHVDDPPTDDRRRHRAAQRPAVERRVARPRSRLRQVHRRRDATGR